MAMTVPSRFQPIHFFRRDRFSATFLATDQRLGRNEVVVKMIGKSVAGPVDEVTGTLRWYQGLRHSLISEVLDAGLSRGGDLYVVRQHHAGPDFFSAPDVNRVKSLLSAVDFLYSKGRVHGSIKPQNIFTDGKGVLLVDPWMGPLLAGSQKCLTEADVRFTAPEVLAGAALSRQSDLYSLGAVLYRFFSGRDPFEDSDIETLKAKYVWASPRPLTTVSHVSSEVGHMVGNLLHRDPERRQAGFEALKREFEVVETPALRAPAVGINQQIEKVLRVVLQRGAVRVVLLEAPHGLGKSRLAAEIRSQSSLVDPRIEVRELKGQHVVRALGEALVSVVDERKLSLRSSCLSRVRDWLATEIDNSGVSENEANHRDLIAFLAAVAQQTRLLVVIDDIDRANKKALRLLESIVQQPVDLDLTILVTSRSLGMPAKTVSLLEKFVGGNLHRMSIGPLDSIASENLASFFTSDRNRSVAAQEKAAGNPLFLEAYARSAAGSPKIVQSALSNMIERIPEHSRSVAEVLSVLRHRVEWSVLVNMTGMPEADLREAAAPLARIGLTREEPPLIQYPDARILLENGLSRSKRMDLHANAFRCLRDNGCNEAVLADHAFNGGLYRDAASLYRKLAREQFQQTDRSSAAANFTQVLECRAKDPKVEPLDGWDAANLASSYAFLGKENAARRLLQQLRQSKAVSEDPELLSMVYAILASPLLEHSTEKRIALMRLAIAYLPEAAPSLIRRYRNLAWIFLAVGDTDQAEKTLIEGKVRCASLDPDDQFADVRGSILMVQGNYKIAAEVLMSAETSWVTAGQIKNNLAVCFEHLGDLIRARELELAAHIEAKGILFGEIMSSSNLGSIETKMGNMAEGERYFSLALSKLKKLQAQEGSTSLSFGITYADAALHFLQKGDFQSARQCMSHIDFDRSRPFFPLETLSVLHTRCYLEVATGRRKAALNTLKQARQVPLKGEFFEIEHLLTESRINEATKDFSRRLQESIVVTQRLGTLYQECQLLLALARVSLSLHDITEANRVARRARRLCGMRGYRLLEAEALLLVGLSSKRRLEKEFFLSRSLNESSQLGLIPLAAECAFSIGSWEFQIGHLGAASEYLAKSVSITSRIAETLTAKHRKSYLDLPNHRAARDLLKRATKGTPVTLEFPGLRQKEHSFFADLYRLVVAMNTSPEVDSATKRLLEGLKSSLDYPVTVVVGLGAAPGFHSLPPTVSEQKKQQILSTAAIAGNRTYISGSGPHQRKKTTVWVPLLSLTQPGGLYMECPGHRYAPEERQIEFLTLVGTVAGAVLDGFAARTTVVAHPSSSVQNGVVGASKQLGEIHQQVEIAATNDANVLIEGESGTGKELVARAIHSQSTRSKGPFVAVDCGALPEALIESELFGAKRGSYTGSLSDRVGLFETAHKGTIFLDEISNLGVAAQAKLLRVLQDREVRQIGSTTTKFVDVRLIAATNCNLEKLVHQDRFRKDLLYRLKVLYIVIPPLRERKSDIPVLATTFLGRLNIRNQTQKYFGPMVMPKLTASSYPGNVRELQNVVERAFYSTRGPVITQIAFLEDGFQHSSSSDVEDWFRDLTEGRQDFWREVHDRYKRRDIPRERVVALVDYGLRITHGSYKSMASKFQISKEEYRRFMDFLRRSKCLLDFRPYRRMSDGHDSL